MDPQKELDALEAERTTLLKTLDRENVAHADVERADFIAKRIPELRETLAKRKAAEDRLRASGAVGKTYDGPRPEDDVDDDTRGFGGRAKTSPAPVRHAASFARFGAAVAKTFRGADPVVGGISKALVPSGSITVDYEGEIAVEPRPSFFVASAIPHRPVDAPQGAFLRQSERDNKAAPVAVGSQKPVSTYGFGADTWHVATLAHLSEPVARQHVNDFPGLMPELTSELGYGLAVALDEYILRGGTAEDGTEVDGILTADGVDTTTFATDGLTTTRYAIGELEEDGVAPTAFVLHPRDWRDLELAREQSGAGAFLLDGAPHARPTRTLWGLPVVLSTGVGVGTGIVADFTSMAVLVREGIVINWTEQGVYTEAEQVRDLHATNRLRFRAEGRYGLQLAMPSAIRKIALTVDGGDDEPVEETNPE